MEQVHINPIENCVNSHIVPIIPDWLDNKTFSSKEPIDNKSDATIIYRYLSEVIDVDSLINSPLTEEQKADDNRRVYLIKAPMGCGKTKIITDLTTQYHQIGQPVGQMLIYKKNLQDIIENTPEVEYHSMLTPKQIKEGLADDGIERKTIQTYLIKIVDFFSENIYQIVKLEDESLYKECVKAGLDPHQVVEKYFNNRIIFIDEADFLINMLQSFAASFRDSITITKKKRYLLLREAAKLFYLDLSKKAKAVVLFTATTTSEFMGILPSSTMLINPNDYLNENERMRSISIKSITYVPFVEWRFRGDTGTRLTDIVVDDILNKEADADKRLFFSPKLSLQEVEPIAHRFPNGTISLFLPYNKMTKALRERCIISEEAEMTLGSYNSMVYNHNKENTLQRPKKPISKKNLKLQSAIAKKLTKQLGIKVYPINDPLLEENPEVGTLYKELCDANVENLHMFFITGSNCRASNLLKKLNKVTVITDAPLTAEVIQALGRFRNAPIYVYILDSMDSNLNYDEVEFVSAQKRNEVDAKRTKVSSKDPRYVKKSDIERSSKSIWKKHSDFLYAKWSKINSPNGVDTTEADRINSLMDVIEDFDFTLANSMTDWEINVDLRYCHPEFSPSVKEIPKDIKVRNKSTFDKKASIYLEFVRAFPELSLNEGLATFKEFNPETTISKPTYIRYRKMFKEIIEAFTSNPEMTDREICSFLKENYNYNFESAFIKTYRPK